MKTLGEYHDLYLKSDVLLLADVFENFRETCFQYYKLDPAHYYSAPGLSWNACLKMTGIELELISDVDMYLMIEKGLRGGMSVITHRKAVASNKYMSSYDPDKPSKYINISRCQFIVFMVYESVFAIRWFQMDRIQKVSVSTI